MITHLLRLIWSRRRSTLLSIVEIVLSTLALFAVALVGLDNLAKYRMPLGFEYQDVWMVAIDFQATEWGQEAREKVERAVREVRNLPQVRAAALTAAAPFSNAGIYTTLAADGITVRSAAWEVDDAFLEVMELQVVEGRFFEPSDEALGFVPLVIDSALREERFGSDRAVGRTIGVTRSGTELRVVGVVSAFRHRGDLMTPESFAFFRSRADKPWMPLSKLLIRVEPGTPVEFEETLVDRLHGIAPEWSFEVGALEDMRQTYLRDSLLMPLVGAVVAVILVLTVGLGLIGVLWQSVIRRTRELGLRRAVGASRRRILHQIVAELLLVSTLGISLAAVLILHLWTFGVLAHIGAVVCVQAMAMAVALILALTALCALYPSWLASTVRPAEALHHE